MDVREKLIELLKTNACPSPFMCDPACRYYGFGDCFPDRFADYLIANGVTVQECKVAEIDQFKLPIDDAILILKEEYKQRVDGYATHLSYGGNGDPAEEVHIDALGMAIAALELQKQTFPHYQKENDNDCIKTLPQLRRKDGRNCGG